MNGKLLLLFIVLFFVGCGFQVDKFINDFQESIKEPVTDQTVLKDSLVLLRDRQPEYAAVIHSTTSADVVWSECSGIRDSSGICDQEWILKIPIDAPQLKGHNHGAGDNHLFESMLREHLKKSSFRLGTIQSRRWEHCAKRHFTIRVEDIQDETSRICYIEINGSDKDLREALKDLPQSP